MGGGGCILHCYVRSSLLSPYFLPFWYPYILLHFLMFFITCNNTVHGGLFLLTQTQSFLLLQVQTETILITPRYAQEHATVIGSYTTFETRSIYIGSGGQDADTRLQVPIVPAGRFSANTSATIKITAALNGPMLNQPSVDRDPQISITDGRIMNEYQFHDINNYPGLSPCLALSASGTQKTLSTGPVPDQFTFLFKPAEKFGACSTAQNGGFANVATFNNQLDLSLGISLRLRMNQAHEDIRYYYFLVEITQ